MPKLDSLFQMMVGQGASDLHLISGQPPAIRINGELERVAGENILEPDALRELLYEITPVAKKDHFESTGDVDFGYEIIGVSAPTFSNRNMAAERSSEEFPTRYSPPRSWGCLQS